MVVSIVLVAAVKAREGQLYGRPGDRTVFRAYEAPEVPPLPAPLADRVPAAGA
ncbi:MULTISPECIES: hypothetical protein [unclassified Blastococcus]|uniref:hypothetical protein n=1 Tax=unclassified Blastococcus TaxID=2619396 RepID=UPI001EF119E7|nr:MULTISPECIES: hypothetical protein [unclassified Blastococcus]